MAIRWKVKLPVLGLIIFAGISWQEFKNDFHISEISTPKNVGSVVD